MLCLQSLDTVFGVFSPQDMVCVVFRPLNVVCGVFSPQDTICGLCIRMFTVCVGSGEFGPSNYVNEHLPLIP